MMVASKGGPLGDLPEMARARKALKPVIIYFYYGTENTRWSKACRTLNTKTLDDTGIVKISKSYLCFAVDFSKLHTSLRVKFTIKAAPAMMFADPFGKVLYNLSSHSLTRKTIEGVMKTGLRRSKSTVKTYVRKRDAWEKKFKEADRLLTRNDFDKSEKILDKLLLTAPSPEHETKAREAVNTIPAARLYKEALEDLEGGREEECVQKLERIMGMEGAGKFSKLASTALADV
ncbi:MAG: hypothetical protein ACYTFG_04105, partial [Planctomycetota bacterium]